MNVRIHLERHAAGNDASPSSRPFIRPVELPPLQG